LQAGTSLGKILCNREKWLAFFKENDGIATVYDNKEIALTKRKDLFKNINTIVQDPKLIKIAPKAPRAKKNKPVVSIDLPMFPDMPKTEP